MSAAGTAPEGRIRAPFLSRLLRENLTILEELIGFFEHNIGRKPQRRGPFIVASFPGHRPFTRALFPRSDRTANIREIASESVQMTVSATHQPFSTAAVNA
jgi:hypothetical protein